MLSITSVVPKFTRDEIKPYSVINLYVFSKRR